MPYYELNHGTRSLLAECALMFGTDSERDSVAEVTLEQTPPKPVRIGSENYQSVIRWTVSVPARVRRQVFGLGGARLLQGTLEGGEAPRTGQIVQAFAGFRVRELRTLELTSRGASYESSRIFTTGVDLLYTADDDELGLSVPARFGLRGIARYGSHRPTGFGLKLEAGYNNESVGFYALFGIGITGAL